MIQYNRSYQKLSPMGIVLHETATPGATAQNEFDYFNSAERGASAHAFVDWKEVIQCVPYEEVAWHAGPTANGRYIGIELCHATTKEQFDRTWDRAVSLFANLFRQYDLGEVSVDTLLSHAEVSARWRETNHTDPIDYFRKFGKTVNEFRDAVSAALKGEGEMIYNYVDENMPAWARPTIQKLLDKGYLVGNEKGELELNDTMLKLLVIQDRAGLYD